MLKPKPENAKPSALGDFSFPTATEARSVPVVWGTCHVQGANVVWYGDLKTKPIKQKSGLFSSTTVGYYYNLGIQMAICHGPIDEFLEIRCDGKKPKCTITATDYGCKVTVNDAEFFGERKREGGLRGVIHVYYGSDSQLPNEYLESKIGKNLPAYRGVAYAVFQSFYVGNSNYIKPFTFIVRRCPNLLGLASGANNISGDANPAEMIHEFVTTQKWGMGLPSASLDLDSFRRCGNSLAAESTGLSIMMDSPTAAKDEGDVICRHIDGLVYQDPATAAITMALVRNDYDAATVPCLGQGCIKSMELTRKSWSETKNCVKVTYLDRAQDYTERVVTQQDLANITARAGQVSSESIELKGFSNAAAANNAAARMLRTLAFPIAALHLEVNRVAWNLHPGSVVRLQWAPLSIDGIYRVGGVNYGGLEDGWIELDCTEDIFAVVGDAYLPPPASDWTDPADTVDLQTRPVEVANLSATAINYAGGNQYTATWTWTDATSTRPAPESVFLLYGPADGDVADYVLATPDGVEKPTATFSWTTGAAPAAQMRVVAVAQSEAGYPDGPDPHWTGDPAHATTLAADCDAEDLSVTVTSAAALEAVAGTVLQILSATSEEFAAVASVAGDTVTLASQDGERATLHDTEPQSHLSGSAVSVAAMESPSALVTPGTVADSDVPGGPSALSVAVNGYNIIVRWAPPADNANGILEYQVRVGACLYVESAGVWTIPTGVTVTVDATQREATVRVSESGGYAVGVAAVNAYGPGPMAIFEEES